MVDPVYKARVEAGGRYLDSVSPGWWDEIDAENLNINDHHMCCLGQLYGSYATGVFALNLSPDEAVAYGFAVMPQDGAQLSEIWRKEVSIKKAVEEVCVV